MIALESIQHYQDNGWTVAPGMFSSEEVELLRDHFMQLRGQGTYPGDFDGVDITSSDPLKKFPRMIHMHRWDTLSLKWLLDPRIAAALTALEGVEPYAVQTMLYFKPAGARGQALHQDQFYLKAQPGTCVAAWLALDDCDEENGCMRVVPGSQKWPLLCTTAADTSQSFTDVTVPIPDDCEPTPVCMKAGDVMFFNGQVVHGSYPNVSRSRFRRALIGHYITGNASKVAEFYHPALRMDGSLIELETSPGGGPCGVWSGGLVEMVQQNTEAASLHE